MVVSAEMPPRCSPFTMPNTLIWDLDGTLFDTYPAVAKGFQAAMAEAGHRVTLDDAYRRAKVSFSQAARSFATEFGLDSGALMTEFWRQYGRIPVADQPPFAGVVAILEQMVTTGGRNFIVTHRGRASTAEFLATFQLDYLFSDFTAGDDGFARKPDPAAYLALIERNAIVPAESLAIGDRRIDAQGARAAGLPTALFGSGFSAEDADILFDDYGELRRWISAETNAASE